VNAWSRILRARNGDVEGKAPPSRNDEYLFFQNLVATWPVEWTELQTLDAEELRSYGARLKRAMVKSMREARIDTNWIAPNTEYEKSVTEFVSDALDPERSEAFFASFLPFEKRVAELGVRNSLAQVVLKLTSPGVPDFYQGSEFWDLSMSDPDNRREVDYEARKNALREWSKARKNDQRRTLEVFWQSRHNGHIKLAVTHSLLEFRRNRSELLEKGTYESLLVKDADGVPNEAVCAFKRRLAGDEIVVVVSTDARLTRIDFEEQEITIADEASCEWQDVFTRRAFSTDDGAINVAEIFDIATFSVLVKLTR
jgi:(1->4)-alpha-D-glucan 1-alpha-D-glucosylmutase